MAFDYKKEYKEFYMPKGTPSIVTVPKMNYMAVRGSGDPNDPLTVLKHQLHPEQVISFIGHVKSRDRQDLLPRLRHRRHIGAHQLLAQHTFVQIQPCRVISFSNGICQYEGF